jgi:hypothetical protein
MRGAFILKVGHVCIVVSIHILKYVIVLDSVRHLAKDCDKKDVEKKKTGEIELGVIDLKQGADDDDVWVAHACGS